MAKFHARQGGSHRQDAAMSRRRKVQALAAAVAMCAVGFSAPGSASASTASAAPSAGVPRTVTWTSCGDQLECARVPVPLDWSKPNGKHIKLGGASPAKQALAAGLCDEILIHLAPYLLGGGVRLFDALPDGIRLKKLAVHDGPHATHLRYRVLKS